MQSDGYRQKENWASIPREGSSLIAQCFLIYCGGIKGEVPPMDFLPPQLQGVLSSQGGLAWKADLPQTCSPVTSQPLSQGCSPWAEQAAPDDASRERDHVCMEVRLNMLSWGVHCLWVATAVIFKFFWLLGLCFSQFFLFSPHPPPTQSNKASGSASQISLHKLD